MDDNNYATQLDSYVTTSSLQVAKVSTKKVPRLNYLVLVKRWEISPKKALNMIHQIRQYGVHTVLYTSLSSWFKTNDHQLLYRRIQHNVYRDNLFATTVSRRGNWCAQIFATNFG